VKTISRQINDNGVLMEDVHKNFGAFTFQINVRVKVVTNQVATNTSTLTEFGTAVKKLEKIQERVQNL
jgi:hypothetical protein